MLRISEHFHYYFAAEEHTKRIQEILNSDNMPFPLVEKLFFRNNEETNHLCVAIIPENDTYRIESSYYIGLGWLPNWNNPVYIEPKVNRVTKQLDYLTMLTEALKEPENFNHLDDLVDIRFDEPWIAVESGHQIHLTPFIIAQFLMTVRSIVRKGLKKDYYRVTENLKGKVKGKILVAQQIRQNVVRNKLTNTVCSYQEYGIDTATNRFLKYVLHFVSAHIANLQEPELKNTLQEQLVFNRAAFQLVQHQQFYSFEQKELNPLYKEYNVAIALGNQLLKLLDHNLSKATECLAHYPPHWIDMSKLFELYVFKRLRETFPGSNEVRYHVKTNRQELDFVIHSGNFKAVVDAKYKPRYASGNPSMDDARQLSGYARLKTVYKELKIDTNELIPVYVVYPKAIAKEDYSVQEEEQEVFDERVDGNSRYEAGMSLFGKEEEIRKSSSYREMYLQEITLEVSSSIISNSPSNS